MNSKSNTSLEMIAMANEIELFIKKVVPQASTIEKYGGTLFSLRPQEKEGQFCGIFIYKTHVQLSFSQGASLHDPDSILLGKGKQRRHLNYQSTTDIDYQHLQDLIGQAASLSID